MKKKLFSVLLVVLVASVSAFAQDAEDDVEYKLLATTRTKTMQKELKQAAAQGYRIKVGAPTSGSEMAVFLAREGSVADPYEYKLLATRRTSTMQKELNKMSDEGFRLIPSTMIAKKQLIGGDEIVVIMERPPNATVKYEYKLLATTRTSTLQKEVTEAKEAGYVLVGMVSRDEHMVIMERVSPLE